MRTETIEWQRKCTRAQLGKHQAHPNSPSPGKPHRVPRRSHSSLTDIPDKQVCQHARDTTAEAAPGDACEPLECRDRSGEQWLLSTKGNPLALYLHRLPSLIPIQPTKVDNIIPILQMGKV